MDEILQRRSLLLKRGTDSSGIVVYWMSRDQRIGENWALNFAFQLATENNIGLAVVFCVASNFMGATTRHYGFMLKGLKQTALALSERNIPFYMLTGNPPDEIPLFCKKLSVSHLITDFDPLKIKRNWLQQVCDRTDAFVITVDAHNVVPAFLASAKAEYGAYTLRPKITRLLPVFMNEFPELPSFKKNSVREAGPINWEEIEARLCGDASVGEVEWCLPGEDEANKALQHFLEHKLEAYASKRNNPVLDATSGLSPYLHYGHLSAQHVAQRVLKANVDPASSAAFLEELIVRRELADNFCFYNPDYDTFQGFPEWARKSLDLHRSDAREFLYSFEEFEKGLTHDALWNAAQKEMVSRGKMHGFMRMYWAKKILEWTASPEIALSTAIHLHNKYSLDGRDPNTYAGCSWAIGGVHDRAWNQHPVYGMIRYMNNNGCKRKFDVDAYIKQFNSISLFELGF